MKSLLVSMLLLLWGQGVAAAVRNADFMFSHVNADREFVDMKVNCIFKDIHGFMWFGTTKGLMRYDGESIVRAGFDEEGSPLDYEVLEIQDDAEGRLWIRNGSGYLLYDPSLRRVTEEVQPEMRRLVGAECTPVLLHIDAHKTFWVWDGRSLYCNGGDRGDARCYTPENRGWDPVAVMRRDDLCVLLYADGVADCLDAVTLTLKRRLPPPNRGDKEFIFRFLYVDSDHDVWITDSSYGLWCYTFSGRRWISFGEQQGVDYTLSNNSVRGLVEDREGDIWIATDHGGINIFDKETGDMSQLTHDPYDRTSLLSNSVYSLYRDDEGDIWVGYYRWGVSCYCRQKQEFFIRHLRTLTDRNLQDAVNAICEDDEGNLWFGTDEYGVVRCDRRSGRETLFDVRSGSLCSDVATCLLCDAGGRVWIGTYQGGLSCYDHGRFIHYRHRRGDANSLADDNVWSIDEDCDGNIWIGMLYGGVQSLDPRTGRFESYTAADGMLASDCVLTVYCRRGERVYVGTVEGLSIIDVATRRRADPAFGGIGAGGFGSPAIFDIIIDSRGLFWGIDGRGRVGIYDPERDETLEVPEFRGCIVKSVIEDDNRNIWLSSDNGIFSVIVGRDPATGERTLATYCYQRLTGDELSARSYNERSATKSRRGEILFGGLNGYYLIDPDKSDVGQADRASRVVFTSLRVHNAEVAVGMPCDGRVVLKRSIEFADRIDLSHSSSLFSVEFARLDYSSPFRPELFYLLDGFSGEWISAGKRNVATFTNLSPGEYRLRVKAMRSDGTLGDDEAVLKIVVHPPFWRTTLACMLYVLAVVLAVWGAVLLLLRRQQRRLEQQRQDLENERRIQMNEMKIRFFTNISHDFRTPLSLIITPLDELLAHRLDDYTRNYLQIIHRNAVRLLNLVNQLLDFRKLDVYGTTLNRSHGDFVAFAREICSSFKLLSENAHVGLTVVSDEERIGLSFDRDKMSKVIMNLLSNAFKYTAEGEVTVAIGRASDADGRPLLAVEVRDTGTGVADADKQHIFDRFYQADTPERNGSGIGLHIVREFVLLHGGEISVRDNAPRGSVFRFTIPVTETAAPAGTEDPALEEASDPDAEAAAAETELRTTILLVEDNDEFRAFMRDSLAADYEIVEAGDGCEALEVLRRHTVSMIISDVMMPRMDGLELCKRVKDDIATSHIPIILLTARTLQEHELEGLAVGADEYVTKPFNLAILKLRIAKLLEWTKRSHELFRQKTEIRPAEITITSLDEKLIGNAIRIVEENMDNSDFSVEEFSAKLGMHRTHLYKKLMFITGKSPLEFIRIVRLKRAVQLLEKSQMNISEVAYSVGFSSPKLFAKYFKEEFNLSPRDYLRAHGGKNHPE